MSRLSDKARARGQFVEEMRVDDPPELNNGGQQSGWVNPEPPMPTGNYGVSQPPQQGNTPGTVREEAIGSGVSRPYYGNTPQTVSGDTSWGQNPAPQGELPLMGGDDGFNPSDDLPMLGGGDTSGQGQYQTVPDTTMPTLGGSTSNSGLPELGHRQSDPLENNGLPVLPSMQRNPQELTQRSALVQNRNAVRQETIQENRKKTLSYHDLEQNISGFNALDMFVRNALTQTFGKQMEEKPKDGVYSEDFKKKIKDFVYSAARRKAEQDNQRIPEHLLEYYAKYLWDDIFGLSVLQDLLDDDSVTEILVYNAQHVDVERKGKLETTGIVFRGPSHVKDLIDRIIAPLGREINEVNPNVDGRLPNKSRVSATIAPIAIEGPTISIRKFPKSAWTGEDLISFGTMDEKIRYTLERIIQSKKNIFVSGGTGSGKTVTLNALSNYIDPHNRIITIEDLAELQLNHPRVEGYEARPGNADGKGRVEIRDILKWTLRKRPDCIIVGECRGGEALDMLQALNTGHYGYSTGHANNPRDLIQRLMTMVWMAGVDWPSISVIRQIASAIDFIVQVQRLRDGSRKVVKVTEVAGVGEEGAKALGIDHNPSRGDDYVYLHDIFEWVETGEGEDGTLTGEFVTRNRPLCFRELKQLSGLEDIWTEKKEA